MTVDNQYDTDITSEEFKDWTENRVTKLVISKVLQKRDEVIGHVAQGLCRIDEPLNTYDFHTGQIRGLMELFMLFDEAAVEDAVDGVAYDH